MLRRIFSSLFASLVLLGSITIVCAQDPPRAAESTNEITTGTITGRVVNERGEPMPAAYVTVRAVGSINMARPVSSDAEGNFRVTGLEPALYIVNGFSPAYVLQPPEASDTPVPYYRIGDTVRLELIRGGVLTGTVLNSAGEPIVGIRVRALRIRDAAGKTPGTGGFMAERPTDDRGIYRIYGLPAGSYLVSAGGPGNQSFQLNPFETDVPTFSPSSTRDNATEYTVRAGEETTADIRYRSDSGRTISGTVKVASNSSAAIVLTSADGLGMQISNAFQQPGARGFALTGVPDGEYNIFAQEVFSGPASPGVIPNLAMSEMRRITVKGADVSGIELVPRPLSMLSGIISLEPSKAPECAGKRKPLFAETLVELQRHEKDVASLPMLQRTGPGTTSPDQKGAFVFRYLMPGRFRLNPRFYARYWYLQSISIGAPAAATAAKTGPSRNDAAATWTTIKFGDQISNLKITLAEGAASIRGKLTVAEGATIPAGAAVYLVPAEREKADDVLRYFVAPIASDGAFALNNLPPGRYWSLLQNAAPADTATLTKLRLPESAEARTKLRRAAETQKSDIELKPCQTVADYQLTLK